MVMTASGAVLVVVGMIVVTGVVVMVVLVVVSASRAVLVVVGMIVVTGVVVMVVIVGMPMFASLVFVTVVLFSSRQDVGAEDFFQRNP